MDMRTLRVVFTAAAVLLALNASAQPTERGVLVSGVGINSCAWWLSSESTKNAGQHYIQGYLSGMNWAQNSQVGRSTDNDGWLGEVEKECREAPSMLLVVAAHRVYQRLSAIAR
jgi:hypothetical protein